MTFNDPIWLSLLALVPLVLGMHLRRRRPVRVSSVLLWKRLSDLSARKGRRGRLQPSWPLLLQVLTLILIALAMSGPTLGSPPPSGHALIVIDTSASMLATLEDGTRFDRARSRLLAYLHRGLRAGSLERVTLLATAPPRFLVKAADSVALAIDEVERLEAQAQASDWTSVGKLVSRLAAEDDALSVTVIGDEVPAWGIEEFSFLPVRGDNVNLALDEVSVEHVEGNEWLVAGTVRQYPADATRSAPADTLDRSGSDHPTDLLLEFQPSGSDSAIRWREIPLEFDAAGTAHFHARLELPDGGYLRVSLPRDGLELDNVHHVVVHPEGVPFRILAVGDVDASLLRALEILPGAQVAIRSDLPVDSATYDLVVAGNGLERHPGTNTLWLPIAEGATTIPTPEVASINERHPASRDLDLATLRIDAAQAMEPLPGATTLLGGGDFPLIQVRHSATGTDLFMAFRPDDSNWPDLASFPVFIASLAKLIVPEAGEFVQEGCLAGGSCRLDPRVVAGEWQLSGPDGEARAFPNAGLPWVPSEALGTRSLATPGLYRTNGRVSPVNFAAPSESSAFGPLEGRWTGGKSEEMLSKGLFAAALLLLVAELLAAARLGHLAIPHRGGRLEGSTLLQLLIRAVVVCLLLMAVFQVPLALPLRPADRILLVESGEQLTGPAALARAKALTQAAEEGWLVVDGGPHPSDAVDDALALVPGADVSPDVLLVTSGNSESNDLVTDTGMLSRQAGARVSFLPLPVPQAGEVEVSSVTSWQAAQAGRPFELHFILHAFGPVHSTYRLLRDGQIVQEGAVDLASGDHRLVFERTEARGGSRVYELELETLGDDLTGNNAAGAVVSVSEGPRVGIFAADSLAGQRFRDAISLHGIEAEVLTTDQFPHYLDSDSLRGWRDYDVVVLMNVPALELSSEQQEQMTQWVRDHGGGLLVLSGPNTFGPGGYYSTKLEELLPLSTKVPQEKAAVAIAFVVDRSGSMRQLVDNVQRLEIAKAATMEAIGLLDQESLVTVVAFDADARTVVPLQNPTNRTAIDRALAELTPGGGTSIYPGLERAFTELMKADPGMSRHIVLMTDGLSQPGEFESLVAEIRSAGITVSTAAIGASADGTLVQDIARWGNGSSHVTDDFNALPSILAQEALLLSDDPVQRDAFLPSVGIGTEFTRNVSLPGLHGFVMTTERPEATVHYYASDEAPLLASWRYGLGRVAAFTSQGAGPWVEPWMKLESFPVLWVQLIRWLMPPDSPPNGLSVHQLGDKLRIEVFGQSESRIASVEGPGGRRVEVELERASMGRQAATISTWGRGTYRVTAVGSDQDSSYMAHSFYVSYPTAFDFSGRDFEEFLWLASITGGSMVEELPAAGKPKVLWLPVSAWPLWGVLAGLLLLTELAMRYLSQALPAGFRGRVVSAAEAPRVTS
ncbi:MAG TPA: VWA domain-containing protein [Trueperaceae bacterium]